MSPMKLMCVVAHPDDESLGMGGTLAKYATEGVETYLVTATRGQYGWFGTPEANPGPDALGDIREAELMKATEVLGIRDVLILDYIDGELDKVSPAEITRKIAMYIERIQPDVIITFDPYGVYGHPDHIAISQFTTAAVVQAAAASHRVAKLYYRVETVEDMAIYEDAFGELVIHIDGVERRAPGWPEWAITTQVDTTAYWRQVWEAVACHQTQLPGYESLHQLPEDQQRLLWGKQTYYRVFSLVNGGRRVETDLFAGLQQEQEL